MGTEKPLIMGAVAYDPKVVTIWDGFQQYFRGRGLDFDYVLFSNYERQVEAQLSDQVHVAWNSPLAWLQTELAAQRLGRRAEAICMRDTDRDLTSIILVRADSQIASTPDLRGNSRRGRRQRFAAGDTHSIESSGRTGLAAARRFPR